jgi:hypothetical protein
MNFQRTVNSVLTVCLNPGDHPKVVIIGFSFQPSDFYAAWLFRYALRYRPDTRVVVVNPDNKKEAFQERMRGLFGDRYDGRWHRFDQIGEMLQEDDSLNAQQ